MNHGYIFLLLFSHSCFLYPLDKRIFLFYVSVYNLINLSFWKCCSSLYYYFSFYIQITVDRIQLMKYSTLLLLFWVKWLKNVFPLSIHAFHIQFYCRYDEKPSLCMTTNSYESCSLKHPSKMDSVIMQIKLIYSKVFSHLNYFNWFKHIRGFLHKLT